MFTVMLLHETAHAITRCTQRVRFDVTRTTPKIHPAPDEIGQEFVVKKLVQLQPREPLLGEYRNNEMGQVLELFLWKGMLDSAVKDWGEGTAMVLKFGKGTEHRVAPPVRIINNGVEEFVPQRIA